jgi:hypothetical protein
MNELPDAPNPGPDTALARGAEPGSSAGLVAAFEARLDTLEQRVAALEHAGAAPAQPMVRPVQKRTAADAAQAGGASTAGAFSVLGRAMLGIAGAYLLRAVAQSDSGLRPAVAGAGVLYALAWLAVAARPRGGASFARITYACTSALILAPMLWELTLGFQVLPPAAAAAALAAFVGVAFAFSGNRATAPVVWIADTTAAALALTLAAAAHAVLPFLLLLLLMVLLAEIAARRGFGYGTRVLAAAAADAALWMQIYFYAGPQNTHPGNGIPGAAVLIVPALALFAISGGSALGGAILRRTPITAFETLQATISFLLAACSLLLFAPAAGAPALRVACFALAAGLLAVSFSRAERAGLERNSAVLATWSAALLLAGLWMSLAEVWLVAALGTAAVASTLSGRLRQRLLPQLHGAVFLLAALLAAGVAGFAAQALAGPIPELPGFAVVFAAGCALLCAALARPLPGQGRGAQALHLSMALAAAGCAAALLVAGTAHLLALGFAPGAHHLAFLRTLVLCGLALALAFAGPRLHRMELTRISFAALALVAVKLIMEDLRHGHLAYSAGSIFLFAITLIAVPRVARGSAKPRENPAV